jgi:CRP/FNR family transcriptional activator FtrB
MRPGISTLRSIPFLERAPARLLNEIDTISNLVDVHAGEELCRQGEPPTVLHVLIDGQVSLCAEAPDGTAAVVEVLRPVTAFVLAAVLTELPYLMGAKAVESSRLVLIPAPQLRAMIRTEQPLTLAMLGTVARDFRGMVRQVRDLKLRTAAQRLGCYLLAQVPSEDAATARIRLPFEKGLLAGRLGCRQDSLSRAFATLRGVGVETHGATVVLHDIPRLRLFAMPDEWDESRK